MNVWYGILGLATGHLDVYLPNFSNLFMIKATRNIKNRIDRELNNPSGIDWVILLAWKS